MKTFLKTFFLVLFISFFFDITAQTVYVNHAATGTNTGSSWVDAYTDLNSALANAPSGGAIWVAQGTYTPDAMNGNSASTFTITQDLVLLGGFDGVSTDPNDQDPEQYVTILSGDLNGDDVNGDLEANRTDNVMTVVTIGSGITNATQIDGFTIRNGHADGTQTNASTQGAGMYIEGSPIIKNCELIDHFSVGNGGAIYVSGQGAEGLTFESCRFDNNKASNSVEYNSVGGAISIFSVYGNGVIFQDCLFEYNEGDWGGGMNAVYSNIHIENSDFLNNFTHRQGGAIRLILENNNSFEVYDSHLEGNSAAFGGAVYFNSDYDNVELIVENTAFVNNHAIVPPLPNWGSGGAAVSYYVSANANNTQVNFENCTVGNNITEGSGAGIRITTAGSNTSINVLKCDFSENESVFHGGGLRIQTTTLANNATMLVDSCTFVKNENSMWTGGGFRALLIGAGNNLTLSNSWFSENYSTLAGGGAAIYGFDPIATGSVEVINNTFESNTGDWDAGLSIGSGTDAGFFEYSISNCDFLNNEAFENGGALDLYGEVPVTFDVSDCHFEGNSAQEIAGGILIALTSPDVEINVRNCVLTQNSSSFGAAIGALPYAEIPADFMTTTEANVLFENCLIYDNSGSGGTVGLMQTGNVQFLNSTIAENQAGGIVLDTSSAATLQNTILYNPGFVEYEAIAADATITSNGGNLLSDNSLGGINSSDIESSNPDFNSSGSENCDYFQLTASSPAIDAGTPWNDVSLSDFCGGERIAGNGIDIGAMENQTIVSTSSLLENQLKLSPNPATDFINITLAIATDKPFEIKLYTTTGKLVYAATISEGETIPVHQLTPGVYHVELMFGNVISNNMFVKN